MRQNLPTLFQKTAVAIDPATIKLVGDRVLVRDLGENDEQIGSIIIPQTASDANRGLGHGGQYRAGVVVSVGPGDFVRQIIDKTGAGAAWGIGMKLQEITRPCPCCYVAGGNDRTRCGFCNGFRHIPTTIPPQCAAGDRVLYDARKHERIYVGSTSYYLMHAEQAVLGILDEKNHLQPLYDRVLVRRVDQRIGLIVVPEVAEPESQHGEVVAAGLGNLISQNAQFVPLDVHRGDRVVFAKRAGADVRVNGEKLFLMREDEIWAVIG